MVLAHALPVGFQKFAMALVMNLLPGSFDLKSHWSRLERVPGNLQALR